MAILKGDNSFATIAEADAYWADRDHATWAGLSTAKKTAALIFATEELNNKYGWPGLIQSQTQKLNWPRYNAYDKQGRLLTGTPTPVVHATAYLAGQHEDSPIFEGDDRGGKIKRIKAGSVEIEYEQGAPAETVYRYVWRVLSDIAISKSKLTRV